MQALIRYHSHNRKLSAFTFYSTGVMSFEFYKADGKPYYFPGHQSSILLSSVTYQNIVSLLRDQSLLSDTELLPNEVAGFVLRTPGNIVKFNGSTVVASTLTSEAGAITLDAGSYSFGNIPDPEANATLLKSFLLKGDSDSEIHIHGQFVNNAGQVCPVSSGSADVGFVVRDVDDPIMFLLYWNNLVTNTFMPIDAVGFIGRASTIPGAGNRILQINTGADGTGYLAQYSTNGSGYVMTIPQAGTNIVLGKVPDCFSLNLLDGTSGDGGGGVYTPAAITSLLSSTSIASGTYVTVQYENDSVGPNGFSRAILSFTPATSSAASMTVTLYPLIAETLCVDRAYETYSINTTSTSGRVVWFDIPVGTFGVRFTAAGANMTNCTANIIPFPQS